ncbi:MAG: hypothetical protein N4A33_01240, partial [Bacteriovoracaceae bacterium]|nr:hypothetical protein [Bacteriovoracaceae bacterium]
MKQLKLLRLLIGIVLITLSSCVGDQSAQEAFGVKTSPDVNINLMAVNPSNKFLFTGESVQFNATGGTPVYTYSMESGVGSVTPTGFYTAPFFAGTAVIKATDAKGESAFATVTVSTPLAISPVSSTIGEGDTINYSAAGGIPPFEYSIVAGSGSIGTSDGVFDATGVSNGSSVVQVRDSSGSTAYASVTVNPALSINPAIQTIGYSEQITFSTTGGNAPYTYAILAGDGTIDTNSGLFTGPASIGSTIVRVTDSSSNTKDAIITIVDKPQFNSAPTTIATNSSVTFSATNGAPPYNFSISSGGGSINPTTGVFSAPSSVQSVTIVVTDVNSNTDTVTVSIYQPHVIAPGIRHTCVIDFTDVTNSIGRCWGTKGNDTNARSLTGENKNYLIGDKSDEIQDYASSNIDLGTGVLAKSVVNGYRNSCAITTTNQLKCWGYNNYGQLGQGSTLYRGQYAGQMGDDLPFINLGTGRTVSSSLEPHHALSLRNYTTCVVLDDGTAKCYGNADHRKNGQNNTTRYGDNPSEVGDGTPAISFGANTITSIAIGYQHGCASLSNGDLKCWGRGHVGQLGTDSTASSVALPNSISAVNLGAGRTASQVCTGSYHTCALLDDGNVKCFGYNNYGQLGQEHTSNLGDGAGEMAALTNIDLGTGYTATQIACANESACAILNDGKVKCWGRNDNGQLGIGDTTHRGNSIGDMGDTLPTLTLGVSRTAVSISAGEQQYCVKLDNGDFKCWGDNPYASLGQGHNYDIGRSLLSMGDNLDPLAPSSSQALTHASANIYNGCGVLADGKLKCWGINIYGSRGTADKIIGDEISEMGSNLPILNMGSSPKLKMMKSWYYTTCAQDDSNQLFCFGEGYEGATATGSNAASGGEASDWADNIPYIDFGAVDTIKDFDVGYRGGCALLTDDSIKCWGENNYGQLGLGHRADRGNNASHLGNFVAADMGTTGTPVQVAAGHIHRCARFDNGKVKCWGHNAYGQLGIGSTTTKGDGGGEMG